MNQSFCNIQWIINMQSLLQKKTFCVFMKVKTFTNKMDFLFKSCKAQIHHYCSIITFFMRKIKFD